MTVVGGVFPRPVILGSGSSFPVILGSGSSFPVILRSGATKNLSGRVFESGEKILRCAQNDNGGRGSE